MMLMMMNSIVYIYICIYRRAALSRVQYSMRFLLTMMSDIFSSEKTIPRQQTRKKSAEEKKTTTPSFGRTDF